MSKISVADLDQNKAAALFIQKLIRHAYHGTIQDTKKLLERGLSWPSPQERLVELHKWFTKLDADGQTQVLQVVEEAASAAIGRLSRSE